MPDGNEPQTLKVLGSIHEVDRDQWNRCVPVGEPFQGHDFLAILEDSGSVTAATGWLPHHVVLLGRNASVLACVPLYLKSHSYGEYVFDWGWAEAYERAGGRYYPKLQAAIPFTPVTGCRLLVHPHAPADAPDIIAQALVRLAERLGVSSLHVTFATAGETARLERHRFLARDGHQFHWHNRGYGSFDDFLADLSSRKRKAIRKERSAVERSGLVVRTLTGGAIERRHWDAFYAFYRNTSDRKWGHAYLTRRFFSLLGERMPDSAVLVIAETGDGHPVAGALNLAGDNVLYGRYWGCERHHRFLHFELCYYRAIDHAIRHRLSRVEAGAQGEHKIQRGYLPVATHSAHWIADPTLRRAVERFSINERDIEQAARRELAAYSPFRSDTE